MIVAPQKRPDRSEENILPLINIVFLLLIFFMLAGALNTRPPFPLTPPETAHASDSQPQADTLAVAADGRLALGSEAVAAEDLAELLADRNKDQPLQVKADTALPARKLTALLSDLRAAGVAQVRLLTVHNP